MLAIRPRAHTLLVLVILLLITTLLLLLLPADPAHALTDPATHRECAQVIWNVESM